MDKNYYEILEISTSASQEIVEKAYKTLVKKYHPDLQTGTKKTEYEEKLKLINEAYEVLSDPQKRRSYDETLPNNNISAEDYETLYRQKEYMKQKISQMEQQQNHAQQNYNQSYGQTNYEQNVASRQQYTPEQLEYLNNLDRIYTQKMQDAVNQAYQDAYVQDLRNMGYKIKYKRSWKDYFAAFLTVLVILLVLFILWQIPVFRNYFINLYHTNTVVKIFVDFVMAFFNGFKI